MKLNRNEAVRFVNLTSHDVHILDEDNNVLLIFPSVADPEAPVRLPVISEDLGDFGVASETTPVRLIRNSYGDVENLPEPRPNTLFIVSSVIQSQTNHRADLVVPSPQVRDAEGNVIGCRGFALCS